MKQKKKYIWLAGIILALAIAGLYIFIPNKISANLSVSTTSTNNAVQRMVNTDTYRIKWLPKEGKHINANTYSLEGCLFSFMPNALQNNIIQIAYKKIKLNATFFTETIHETTNVHLVYMHQSSIQPIIRVSDYLSLKHIQSTLKHMLESLRLFVNNNENIYGVPMEKTILKDSTLISLKATANHYPTVEEIYSNIRFLETYAASEGATLTNPPMLNITKEKENQYSYMVALPINKDLESKGNILSKRLLAGGKILSSGTIKGGFTTVDQFLTELENYRSDRSDNAPAIPYQSLITDRSKETDTSKWITKLYYPVY